MTIPRRERDFKGPLGSSSWGGGNLRSCLALSLDIFVMEVDIFTAYIEIKHIYKKCHNSLGMDLKKVYVHWKVMIYCFLSLIFQQQTNPILSTEYLISRVSTDGLVL